MHKCDVTRWTKRWLERMAGSVKQRSLSVDEMTGIQALERIANDLPMSADKPNVYFTIDNKILTPI